MLTIRESQLQALAEPRVRVYLEQTTKYVRAEYPEEFDKRGEEGVELLVRRAIKDAQTYGLPSSVDVTGLLSLMIILGDEDFVTKPENAELKAILESDIINPSDKIGMLLDELG
ncbi:hypothetical protein [Enhygromyxa salina]|uniref:Uncharacterized protein n=1 Tax=Enhygromyxa salina TaxID=215803 RepID=A0A2S9YNB1_9BACT|nr:hypothetical protein [Enhygromyxa salina]PRQ06583.1 hypothetical protein ENSA7_37360 [Enhygromyxa salina]